MAATSLMASPSDETFKSSISQLFLKRGNAGLGFQVVGGTDSEHLPGVTDPFVAAVVPGGEAERRGLREGDRIVKIDGADVAGMSHDEIVARLCTTRDVELTVEPNGEERLLTESLAISRVFAAAASFDRSQWTAAYVADLKQFEVEPLAMEEPIPEPVKIVEPENEIKPAGPSSVVLFGMGIVVGALAIFSFKQGRLLLKI